MKKGLLVALAFVSVLGASAQFVKLEVESIKNGELPGNTYRLYAVMQNANDLVDAIYGDQNNPMIIETSTSFYQNENGGAFSSDVQRSSVDNDPNMKYDSWVTIGAEDNYGNALTGFLIDMTEFEKGGPIQTTDGAWFVTPDKRQAYAGDDKKVLLLQVTTDGVVTGKVNLHGRTAGNEEWKMEGVPFTMGN